MITETQPHLVVLHLTDEQLAQLQPFLTGLDITILHNVGHATHCLLIRGEVYAVLAERVGAALDYDIRWQPNEYEPDGFIERDRPLELSNDTPTPASCLQRGAQILANQAVIACMCGQVVSLI